MLRLHPIFRATMSHRCRTLENEDNGRSGAGEGTLGCRQCHPRVTCWGCSGEGSIVYWTHQNFQWKLSSSLSET
jgi:hypothetical protein